MLVLVNLFKDGIFLLPKDPERFLLQKYVLHPPPITQYEFLDPIRRLWIGAREVIRVR